MKDLPLVDVIPFLYLRESPGQESDGQEWVRRLRLPHHSWPGHVYKTLGQGPPCLLAG